MRFPNLKLKNAIVRDDGVVFCDITKFLLAKI